MKRTDLKSSHTIQLDLSTVDLEAAVHEYISRHYSTDAQGRVPTISLPGIDRSWAFPVSVRLESVTEWKKKK